MKIRHTSTSEDRVELQMTPMIDIVFQLLVFFVMTFKVVVREGDFNFRMPASSSASSQVEDFDIPVAVKLEAGLNGEIQDIVIDGADFLRDQVTAPNQMYDLLNQRIAERKEKTQVGEFGTELIVEFETDDDLRYEEQIKAITAVTGNFDAEGNPIQLADRVKFKDK